MIISLLRRHQILLLPILQAAMGDNREVYSTLERILSTAAAVGEAFQDKENAEDTELIFHTKALLQ